MEDSRSLTRFVYLLVALASIVIIVFGIQSSAYIVNSILLAAVITIGVLPLPRGLIRRGMRPSAAFILSLVLVVVVLVAIVALAVSSISRVSSELESAESDQSTMLELESDIGPLRDLLPRIQNLISEEDLNKVLEIVVRFAGQFVAQFAAVALIFIFMLSAVIVTPISDQMGEATDSATAERISEVTHDVQQYISITTLVNFLVGLSNAVLLLILGVPFAILWGILSWILGYIPVVGFWLALIPPTLLAWVIQGLPTAVIVFLGFVIINGSVENLVKPRIMGKGLNMTPLVIFISIFFWGWVLGGLGAILAIPLTLIILSVLDSFEVTRWIVVLVRPSTSSEEHERNEATLKLKDVWNRVSNMAKGEN